MEMHIERVLTQLAATFTVRDIMVAVPDLTRGNTQAEAQQLLLSYPDFDVIPLPASGPITSYLERGRVSIEKVQSSDLISDGTSLLDLPKLMTERAFYFVLSANTICGFVHFSDLNKSLMKLPFFVLFEAVERYLWSSVADKSIERDLENILGPQRAEALQSKMDKARKKDVNVGWSGMLSFAEILRFSVHYGLIRLPGGDLDLLANVRNRVAHSDRLLVEAHKDAQKLVQSRILCQQLLASSLGA